MSNRLKGRRLPKARTGCWTCKKRKVKCSEEKPVCHACSRLQLSCQYGLRLQWGGDPGLDMSTDAEKTTYEVYLNSLCIAGSLQSSYGSEKAAQPAQPHYIHFTMSDFQPRLEHDVPSLPHSTPLLDLVSYSEDSPSHGSSSASGTSPLQTSSMASDSSPFACSPAVPPLSDISSLPFTPDASVEQEPGLFPCQPWQFWNDDLRLLDEPAWIPPLEMSSPLDSLLFTYYVSEICTKCTMFDDSSNGFRTIIIPMSANHPSVLHSILAVAAFFRRREDPAYYVEALEQKEKALVNLRRFYPDAPERRHEEMIAAAIMLCVFEIKDGSGPNWDKHLNGGRSILQSRVDARGQGALSDDLEGMWSAGISWWANKFFGYQCVNGAAASSMTNVVRPSRLEDSDSEMDTRSVPTTCLFWLSQGLTRQEIDGFMGCSSELMAITSEMSSLVQAPCASLDDVTMVNNNNMNMNRIDRIERRLFQLRQSSCHAFPLVFSEDVHLTETIAACLSCSSPIPLRAKMLILTAEARRQAAFVFLYTCLKGLPVTQAAVQSRVSQALSCISAVSGLMDARDAPIWGMTPLVWPLFVVGSAVLLEEQRFVVLEIFRQLQSRKCLGNAARARDAVTAVWKQHDLATTRHDEPFLSRVFLRPNDKWPLSLG